MNFAWKRRSGPLSNSDWRRGGKGREKDDRNGRNGKKEKRRDGEGLFLICRYSSRDKLLRHRRAAPAPPRNREPVSPFIADNCGSCAPPKPRRSIFSFDTNRLNYRRQFRSPLPPTRPIYRVIRNNRFKKKIQNPNQILRQFFLLQNFIKSLIFNLYTEKTI